MRISSHPYVAPSGDATREACDFFYNGNDRCAEEPASHLGWEGISAHQRLYNPPLTVRQYINELNRLVILGEVDEDSTVVFNLLSTHTAYPPRVAPDGRLVIVG